MDTFFSTFQAVAVLLFLGVIGFALVSKKFLASEVLGHMSPLVLEVALPSLIFVKLIKNFDPYTAADKFVLPLYWLGLTLVLFVMARVFSFVARREKRSEFLVSLFYQNAKFIPIVLISKMYGSDSSQLVDLFLFTVLFPAFFFNTYHLFFPNKQGKIDLKKIFHPVPIAVIVAIIIKSTGFHVYIPTFVIDGLGLIGDMTIPLLMIVLGGVIYIDSRDLGKLEIFSVVKFVFIKNIVFPAVVLVIVWFFQIEYSIALLVVILSAVPPITALPVVMDRVGGDRHIVNQFLVASLTFSLVSIPVAMTVLDKISNR